MIRRSIPALVAVAVFGLSLLALPRLEIAARDFHVDNIAGDDRNDGSVPEQGSDRVGPMRTIVRALKAAGPGDRIIIAATGEPYRESLALIGGRHGTDDVRPFRIIGNNAVLDGTVAVHPDAWRHETGEVFSFRPHLVGHQLLYRDGRPLKRARIAGADQLSELQPLEWAWVDGRIHFRVETDRLPDSYSLAYCGLETGILIDGVDGVEISDLIVQGFAADGIDARDDVRNATIVGATLRGNGRSGLHVGGASRVKVEACLIGDNGKAQAWLTDYCKVVMERCDLLDVDPAVPPVDAADTVRLDRRF